MSPFSLALDDCGFIIDPNLDVNAMIKQATTFHYADKPLELVPSSTSIIVALKSKLVGKFLGRRN